MKKVIAYFLLAACIFALTGCGKTAVPDSPPPELQIDYGTSALYTKEDMDAAAEKIRAEFDTWGKGYVLHSLTYTSDDVCTAENLDWLNSIEAGKDAETHFTQCICFRSSFHTPKWLPSGENFEEDAEITYFEWWLARIDGGEWQLMTWGE